uniref:Uncharacterized protein n=1 Tax=Anopheles marajoara TaxID=58244 RepID=A0A2M4C397_9DIPT
MMPRNEIRKLPIEYGTKAKITMNAVLSETTQKTCSRKTIEPSRPSNRSHVSSSAARSHSIGFQLASSAATSGSLMAPSPGASPSAAGGGGSAGSIGTLSAGTSGNGAPAARPAAAPRALRASSLAGATAGAGAA